MSRLVYSARGPDFKAMQLITLEHPGGLLLQIKASRAPSLLLFLEEKQCKIKIIEVSLTDRLFFLLRNCVAFTKNLLKEI